MADLKREIKKLQRYREDIMKWVSNPEVKDKSSLADSRRRIEIEMERFKAFERESKTKPFSLIGLAMGGRLDAQEQKKQEKREIIDEFVDKLTVESDEFRVEFDSLMAKKKKTKDETTRVDALKMYSEWHAFHLRSLEQVLRRLNNDMIDPDDIDMLIESLSLYMEQYEEPDFYHDDQLYEQYNLDSDAVDETYYKRTLDEIAEETKNANASSVLVINEAPKLREVPLTAAAKARAKKIAAAGSGGLVRPDHPSQHPPKPVRPAAPTVPPPGLATVQSTPPSRPAPILPGVLPEVATPWRSSPPPPPPPGLSFVLEQSYQTRPSCEDLLRLSPYSPSNPYVHAGYPQRAEWVEQMRNFSLDTLMLIFYYREGTFSQFLASQELKRQNWRFHAKFGIWFKRSSTPKTINASYEFGAYHFFDTESWGVQARNDFTFEYEFLDDDQIPRDCPTQGSIRRPPAL